MWRPVTGFGGCFLPLEKTFGRFLLAGWLSMVAGLLGCLAGLGGWCARILLVTNLTHSTLPRGRWVLRIFYLFTAQPNPTHFFLLPTQFNLTQPSPAQPALPSPAWPIPTRPSPARSAPPSPLQSSTAHGCSPAQPANQPN